MADYIGRRGCCLAMALLGTLVLAGCPADRAMFFDLSVRVLDAEDRPVGGERVYVPGGSLGVLPGEVPAVEEADYHRVGATDANGVATFVVSNREPVGLLSLILFDSMFPPCVEFMVMLPDAQTVGYEARFCPTKEVYESDTLWHRQPGAEMDAVKPPTFAETLRYRRFDVRTGEYLEGTFSDASGGLEIVIGPALRDENEGRLMGHPAVYITVRKDE